MSEQKVVGGSVAIHLLAGIGIGLLVGLIVGSSVSPVVSIILGALASLLAAFLGLQDSLLTSAAKETDDFQRIEFRQRMNSIKAAGFGFACIVGIVAGLFLRSNNVFAPSMEDKMLELTKAGISEDFARELIVMDKFGVKPQGKDVEFGDRQKLQTSALFSEEGKEDICYELSMERFDYDVEKGLKAYRRQNKAKLTALAEVVEGLDISQEDRGKLLNSISEAICEIQ